MVEVCFEMEELVDFFVVVSLLFEWLGEIFVEVLSIVVLCFFMELGLIVKVYDFYLL